MVSKCGFHPERVMISLSIHLLSDKPVEPPMAVTLQDPLRGLINLTTEGALRTSPCHPPHEGTHKGRRGGVMNLQKELFMVRKWD